MNKITSLAFLTSAFLVACSPANPVSPGGVTLGPDGGILSGGDAGFVAGDGEEPGTGARAGGSRSASPSAGDEAADAPTAAGAPSPGASGAAAPAEGSSGGGSQAVPAGILTAGTWDDNRNMDWFLSYRNKQTLARTPGLLPLTEDEHRAAASAALVKAAPHSKLDISLVLDTTGSMGDEIRYLQTEFLAMTSLIAQKYPDAQQRWSLVLYKDITDEYVVRWFDFRGDNDLQGFKAHLDQQSAGGGGDFPESPERGLGKMAQLSWRGDDTAKLAFWVADAPHHANRADAMAQAYRGAKARGVHVYPVASSGIDEFTELTMRSAAQLTGGRYLFLTNDSGVGGAHKEPSVPCYFVTKLNNAILRMVDIELTGQYHEPESADVIRTGGNPQAGACTLDQGQHATVF